MNATELENGKFYRCPTCWKRIFMVTGTNVYTDTDKKSVNVMFSNGEKSLKWFASVVNYRIIEATEDEFLLESIK